VTKKAIMVPTVFDEIRLGTIDGDGIGGFKVEKHDRRKEVRFSRRLRVVLYILNIELQQRRMRVALIDGSKAHVR
jgi:hypothetical protein